MPAQKLSITFVLIHSPLVGPLTWQGVHQEMEKRGLWAITPALVDDPESGLPYWQQHAESLVRSLAVLPANRKLALVVHSGAGPILPALRHPLPNPIGAYVFVDAGIPRQGLNRLELMRLQDSKWAGQFHQSLLQGSRFPDWSEDDLAEVLPDSDVRQKLAADIRPRSLPFFTEPIPVPDGWPDVPCAYIKFSPAYDWDYQQAKQSRWWSQELKAGHFHMLVDPPPVTDLIVAAVRDLAD